ncbi:ribosomal protein S18 acetylase RimI-like enzyme [Agromyces hippuratus]|uniref:Ribosomal protein S18 acetylase RimI-like enzyme n=1 Tax=Agromyces hippuratus TaxID=286438 RepID=A0A852WX44_9MICO|nr:GNAT family N-acetyltransferase [Agromyces hippuratus]NYG22676.1 ribosomal protein S18 acetylase RimI-like enzyme [Agromyces hippuratus]
MQNLTPPFVIRPIGDAETTIEPALIARAFGAGPYGHLPVSEERRALQRDVAGRAASGAVLVAVADGGDESGDGAQLLGTASVLRAGTPYSRVAVGEEAEVRLVAVDPAAQGAGMGEALMRASIETALGWGADALLLDTGERNLRAQALYARLGFDRQPDRDEHFGDVLAFAYRFALQDRADIRVRLMRPDEVEAVTELVESAYASDFELNDAYRADIVAVAERARDHQVWVATDAATGALLGTASTPVAGAAISPLARDGELDFRFLGVAADARRRGVGEVLVAHVIRLARIRGLERVVLNTGPDMLAAQRLYDRLGFQRMHEREFTFERPDGTSFLMIAYGRDLEASAA